MKLLKLETLLDDSVGQNVELEFERSGTSLTVQLVAEDLHSITLSELGVARLCDVHFRSEPPMKADDHT
uniref:Uncharacterized protein n=1 Tax=Helianthus annuus TaxID=4232 RepID=A0A251T343_HELAN